MLILFFLQKLWRIAIDRFFGAGKPGALFKRPANVYTFHDTIMASTEFRARQATGPGAHSSSNNRDDNEKEHKLHEKARKLEEAALKKKRKEASDFLAPPLASLLESRPPLEERQKNKEPLLDSDGKNNNPQDIIIYVDDDGGKENVCPPSIKKNTVPLSPGQIYSTCSLQQWTLLILLPVSLQQRWSNTTKCCS